MDFGGKWDRFFESRVCGQVELAECLKEPLSKGCLVYNSRTRFNSTGPTVNKQRFSVWDIIYLSSEQSKVKQSNLKKKSSSSFQVQTCRVALLVVSEPQPPLYVNDPTKNHPQLWYPTQHAASPTRVPLNLSTQAATDPSNADPFYNVT